MLREGSNLPLPLVTCCTFCVLNFADRFNGAAYTVVAVAVLPLLQAHVGRSDFRVELAAPGLWVAGMLIVVGTGLIVGGALATKLSFGRANELRM